MKFDKRSVTLSLARRLRGLSEAATHAGNLSAAIAAAQREADLLLSLEDQPQEDNSAARASLQKKLDQLAERLAAEMRPPEPEPMPEPEPEAIPEPEPPPLRENVVPLAAHDENAKWRAREYWRRVLPYLPPQ